MKFQPNSPKQLSPRSPFEILEEIKKKETIQLLGQSSKRPTYKNLQTFKALEKAASLLQIDSASANFGPWQQSGGVDTIAPSPLSSHVVQGQGKKQETVTTAATGVKPLPVNQLKINLASPKANRHQTSFLERVDKL